MTRTTKIEFSRERIEDISAAAADHPSGIFGVIADCDQRLADALVMSLTGRIIVLTTQHLSVGHTNEDVQRIVQAKIEECDSPLRLLEALDQLINEGSQMTKQS